MDSNYMPRKKAGYSIDERCVEALKVLAGKTGKSINEYLESLVFSHAQIHGVIGSDEKPLGERRGGKRLGAFRKPTTPIGATEEVTPSEGETIM